MSVPGVAGAGGQPVYSGGMAHPSGLTSMRSPRTEFTHRILQLGRRLLGIALLLFGVTFVSYCLSYLAPGDAAVHLLESKGQPYSQELLDAMRHRMGRDQPLPVQYFRWLANMLHGDMGISLQNGRAVGQEFLRYLPNTVKLTLVSILLTTAVSVLVGTLCAVKPNSVLDYVIRFITYLFASLPNFFFALVVLYFCCVRFHWFPVQAKPDVKGMVMPVTVLTFGLSSYFIRQVRAIVLEELGKDYVAGCHARGISFRRILFCHVLKNVAPPILTMMAISFGSMLGGSSLIESIFSWPGLGRYALTGIQAMDYPVIQAYVVWMSVAYLLVYYLADLVSAILNPQGTGLRTA